MRSAHNLISPTHQQISNFKQEIYFERVMLYAPGYIVSMMGRFTGKIQKNQFLEIVQAMSMKHPFLQAQIIINENHYAWYSINPEMEPIVKFEAKITNNSWKNQIIKEFQQPFDIFQGPLIRYIILKGDKDWDLILFCHHVICDAMALSYLMKDIYILLGKQKLSHEQIQPLYPITLKENIPKKYCVNSGIKQIIKKINSKWEKRAISFRYSDYLGLHKQFWQNHRPYILSWQLTEGLTSELVKKCRLEQVTIHTALCTAFRLAQIDIQGNSAKYFSRVASPVNLRNKLSKKVGETFGLYASGIFTKLKRYAALDFWNTARKYHQKLRKNISHKKIFRIALMGELAPSLVDSLFFAQEGLLNEPITNRLLKLIKWDGINSGIMISNLGRFQIPRKSGSYELISMHGPSIFDLRNQKYLGVITTAGKINLTLTSGYEMMPKNLAKKEVKHAIFLLKQAITTEI